MRHISERWRQQTPWITINSRLRSWLPGSPQYVFRSGLNNHIWFSCYQPCPQRGAKRWNWRRSIGQVRVARKQRIQLLRCPLRHKTPEGLAKRDTSTVSPIQFESFESSAFQRIPLNYRHRKISCTGGSRWIRTNNTKQNPLILANFKLSMQFNTCMRVFIWFPKDFELTMNLDFTCISTRGYPPVPYKKFWQIQQV